jgi:hypothetical protein
MRERIEVGLAAAFLLMVALACRSSSSSSSRSSVDPKLLEDPGKRASRLCERLVVAGVAKNCGQPTQEANGSSVKYDNTVFADERGFVRAWPENNEAAEGALNLLVKADIPVDDYPDTFAFSRENRLLVAPGNPDPWTKCLTANGCTMKVEDENDISMRCASTVYAACSKQYPKQYAKAKAFVDAAKSAVAEP